MLIDLPGSDPRLGGTTSGLKRQDLFLLQREDAYTATSPLGHVDSVRTVDDEIAWDEEVLRSRSAIAELRNVVESRVEHHHDGLQLVGYEQVPAAVSSDAPEDAESPRRGSGSAE